MCRSGQSSVLSLGMSHESKSLFFGVWWHKGWLAVPDRGLSREVEESSSGGSFPIDEISRLQGVMLKVFVARECTMKRLLYKSMVTFNRSS